MDMPTANEFGRHRPGEGRRGMRSVSVNHECHECGNETSSNLLPAEGFEELLKDLDSAAQTMRLASLRAGSLAEKLPYHRAQKAIEAARHSLRQLVFTYQDGAAIARATGKEVER